MKKFRKILFWTFVQFSMMIAFGYALSYLLIGMTAKNDAENIICTLVIIMMSFVLVYCTAIIGKKIKSIIKT